MRLSTRISIVLLAGAATLASAAPLPVGTFTLAGHTTTTGIHQSTDQGTMYGTLTFDPSSTLTSADLTFNDTTAGMLFTFTEVGPTTIDNAGHTLSATISNATDPSETYDFSIIIPGLADGTFRLSCGTDCDTDAHIRVGRTLLNEEVQGNITPTPEPSSLVLLGTGAVGTLGALRRGLQRS